MNKTTTVNVATPFLWAEEDILNQEARAQGKPRSVLMREAFVEYMAKRKPAVAKTLVQIRITHRQQIASTICLAALGLVIYQTAQTSSFERIGYRVGVRVVRNARKLEMEEACV